LFDEECSKLLDITNHAKLQWSQNPSQTNGDNLDNVRRERTSGTKKKLPEKIYEFKTNGKNKKVPQNYT